MFLSPTCLLPIKVTNSQVSHKKYKIVCKHLFEFLPFAFSPHIPLSIYTIHKITLYDKVTKYSTKDFTDISHYCTVMKLIERKIFLLNRSNFCLLRGSTRQNCKGLDSDTGQVNSQRDLKTPQLNYFIYFNRSVT